MCSNLGNTGGHLRAALALLAPALVGCGLFGTDDDGPPGWDGELVLQDDQSFRYASEIDVITVSLPAQTDSWLDWSGLSQDLLGHPLNVHADVNNVQMVVFKNLTEEEVEVGVATDSIPQAEVSLALDFTPVETGAWLSDFLVLGSDIDVEERFEVDTGTWMVVLTHEETETASVYLRVLFIRPDADSTAEQADFTDDNGLLSVTADLVSRAPAVVPAGETFPIAWSGLTLDGLGEQLALHKADTLTVARYPDHTLAELEAEFLDLDLLADQTWTLDVSSSLDADLGDLSSPDGAFTGFTTDATWLLALRCSTCSTSMPQFLAAVEAQ